MAHQKLTESFIERNLPRRKKGAIEALKADNADETVVDQITSAPEADPTKAVPEAPPAAETPPVEAPAAPPPPPSVPEPPKQPEQTVPLHLYTDTRADAKRAREEREAAQRELAEAKRQLDEARKPKEEVKPQDPEPNAQTHPVEHDQWEIRQARREAAEARQEAEKIRQAFDARTQQENNQVQVSNFVNQIEGLKETWRQRGSNGLPAISDIDDRREFMRDRWKQIFVAQGWDENSAKLKASQTEFGFYFEQAKILQQMNGDSRFDPIVVMSRMADSLGYQPKDAAPAAQPKGDKQRIEEAARRQSAARSTGSMPGAPPARVEEEKMSAEKWRSMSMAQRKAYYKAHPELNPRAGGIAALLLDDSNSI